METQPFTLDGYPIEKAMRIARRRGQPASLRWGLLVFLAALLGVLILQGLLARVETVPRPLAAWLPLVLIAVVYAVFLRLRRKSIGQVVARTPILVGRLRASFSDAGIRMESDLARYELKWEAVTGLVPGPDGLLLITQGLGYIPLPAVAFASPAEMEAFATRLRARIPVVKDPF